MVMELVKGKELLDRIAEINFYDEEIAREIFLQLIHAIKYLHDLQICHRDIKPGNILVMKDNERNIKLMDFNVSK